MSFVNRAVISFILVGVGASAGIYLDRTALVTKIPALAASDVTEQGAHYQFINPLLFCQDQNISSLTNSVGNQIHDEISSYIDAQKTAGSLSDAGVYFRDLGDGPWALVNSSFRSIPASLLKVPTAIGVYRRAEKDPSFLSKKVVFDGKNDLNSIQHFPPLEKIEGGKTYTVEDLVRYMLQDSDNNALSLLGNNMDEQDLVDAYSDLGVEVPTSETRAYTISVRTFASFFRVLYNASYLNQTNSEHMLSLLAESKFPQGLEAGVPKNMTVAHKFGEYDSGTGDKQLNDCGIIYRPHHPYLLCIMAKGNNFDTLSKIISTISGRVYDILESQQ